jgi:quercetin dioxygenase-like cupin family protein
MSNFLNTKQTEIINAHFRTKMIKASLLFIIQDFQTSIEGISSATVFSRTTIGKHTHKNDEDIYIVLKGNGMVIADAETREAKAGDIFVDKGFGTHEFMNNSDTDMYVPMLMANS